MKTGVRYLFFLICIGILLHSCGNEAVLPVPEIKCGTAKLSGNFIGINELIKQYSSLKTFSIYCSVINPLTGRTERKKIEIKDDESFSLEMPVEVSSTLGAINLGDVEHYLIPLVAGEETKFNVTVKGRTLEMKWVSGPDFIFGDAEPWNTVFMKALDNPNLNQKYDNLDTIKRSVAEPKEYVSYGLEVTSSRLERLASGSRLPKAVLEMYRYGMVLLSIDHLFWYREDIWNRYRAYRANSQREQGLNNEITYTKNDSIAFYPPEPGASYFSFLKEFNLNDTRFLYFIGSFDVSSILQKILKNENFSIPPIGEMPVDEWLKQAKAILADLVGFSDGNFYDILVCNAYAQQFIDKQEPLSPQQIANIQQFYKGGEVEKVLLRENEKIKSPDKGKGQMTEKEISQMRGKQFVDSIVSKYKGKAVVVDFWATWCGPCLNAMKEIDKIKQDYIDKGVIFVYITNESSPKEKWEVMKLTIKGEHYYLTKDEWKNVVDAFNLKGIPAYMIYDKKGDRVDNMIGYPGNDKMKESIEKALSE